MGLYLTLKLEAGVNRCEDIGVRLEACLSYLDMDVYLPFWQSYALHIMAWVEKYAPQKGREMHELQFSSCLATLYSVITTYAYVPR